LIIAVLVCVVLASAFAQDTAGDIIGKIPPVVALPLALLIAFGGPLLKLIGIGGTVISAVAKSIRKNFVTYERVDKITEALLAGFGVPALFADWVGDVVAKILTEAPQLIEASVEQKSDVVASAYTKLPVNKASALLTVNGTAVVPRNVMQVSFARKRIASKLAAQVIPTISVNA
jgi:hypothetical protein